MYEILLCFIGFILFWCFLFQVFKLAPIHSLSILEALKSSKKYESLIIYSHLILWIIWSSLAFVNYFSFVQEWCSLFSFHLLQFSMHTCSTCSAGVCVSMRAKTPTCDLIMYAQNLWLELLKSLNIFITPTHLHCTKSWRRLAPS